MRKHVLYNFLILFYIAIISIPLILPYFHEGYFPTHDGEWAVVRLADMFRELRDHQIPARYSGNLNFGYGYPLFNFAYPFPYYIGIIFHIFKINFVDTIKLLFAISVPLSGISMFFASKQLWGKTTAGIISATLFLYLPYRLVDLYVRGSIGESLAFVFFPAIFFSILKVLETGKDKWIGFSAFFYGCLILTHNIMAVYFSLLIVFFLIGQLVLFGPKNIVKSFFGLGFGLSLSAFFWIPALFEKQFILLSIVPIADRTINFVSFKQLIFPSWGFGVPGDMNGFTYQLGIPQIIAGVSVILLLFYSFSRKKLILENKIMQRTAVLFGIFCIFSLFLFKFSSPLWKLPLLSEINYPWTLLAPLGFLLSLLAGLLSHKKYGFLLGGAVCILAFIFVKPYAKPEYYVNRGDNFYITNDATTTSSHEYMPLWVKTIPFQRSEKKVTIQKGKGTIKNVSYTSKEINFVADLSEKSSIRIHTIYYPGWVGNITNITYNNDFGVMEFWLEKGSHVISLNFTETPIRLISDILSLISFIFLICFFIVSVLPLRYKKILSYI